MTALCCGIGHCWLVPVDADRRAERCPVCGLMDITEARAISRELLEDTIPRLSKRAQGEATR